MTSPTGADVTGWLCARNSIEVIPLRNAILEALGHHPASDFGEQFWLPIVGPSTLCAHRRLTAGFDTGVRRYQLDIAAFAAEIGLGARVGRNAPVIRTLTRLVDFHLAEVVDGRLGVQTTLPPLTRRQAARLPAHLAVRHQRQAIVASPRSSAERSLSIAEVGR